MDTAVRSAVERVVLLADEHASAFIDCMSQAASVEELQVALSGSASSPSWQKLLG
jgi:hypothetical protein